MTSLSPNPSPDSSSTSPTFSRLLAPLREFVATARHQYLCHKISDWDWIQAGVHRVLSDSISGCAFLQKHNLTDLSNHSSNPAGFLAKSGYFQSFKSPRRLLHLQTLTTGFIQTHAQRALRHPSSQDMLSSSPELGAAFAGLRDFHLYAGDGHFHGASCHEPKDDMETKNAIGHLYALNLRTQFLSHLRLGSQAGVKKPHDMAELKKMNVSTLRQGAGKGEKVLYIWDRAGIDFRQWHHWKNVSGIYFLSRTKCNMKLEHPLPNLYDPADPLNAGIVSDEMVSHSQGGMIRRVSYRVPETGETMSYLTNLGKQIAPGLVAQLYFMRWRIEKAFDEIKNKLGETKAWADSENAKTMQANFLVLAYNLSQLLHADLEKTAGLLDPFVDRKRQQRLKQLEIRLEGEKRVLPLLRKILVKASQLSVKFYRWLRYEMTHASPWSQSVAHLKWLYAHF